MSPQSDKITLRVSHPSAPDPHSRYCRRSPPPCHSAASSPNVRIAPCSASVRRSPCPRRGQKCLSKQSAPFHYFRPRSGRAHPAAPPWHVDFLGTTSFPPPR